MQTVRIVAYLHSAGSGGHGGRIQGWTWRPPLDARIHGRTGRPPLDGRIHGRTCRRPLYLASMAAAARSALSFTGSTDLRISKTPPITARSGTWLGGPSGWGNARCDPATQAADRRSRRWGWPESPPREPGARGLLRNRRWAARAAPYRLQCEATGIYPTCVSAIILRSIRSGRWTGSDRCQWETDDYWRRRAGESWLQNGALCGDVKSISTADRSWTGEGWLHFLDFSLRELCKITTFLVGCYY